MRDYRQLKVWEKSHHLALAIYRITSQFPREEAYGLQSQMRRAATSIPSNIAEGCGRDTYIELLRFFHIAMGSASELDYQLLLTRDLQYISQLDYNKLQADLNEVRRMLTSYAEKIKQTRKSRSKSTSPVPKNGPFTDIPNI